MPTISVMARLRFWAHRLRLAILLGRNAVTDDSKLQATGGWNGNLRPLVLFVLMLWLLNLAAYFYVEADAGTIGDIFGAVNALFSGLAFAALIVAINLQRGDLQMQRKELRLQREELKLTRAELAGQREQLKLQNDVLSTQGFEATFFQTLRLFNESSGADLYPGLADRFKFEFRNRYGEADKFSDERKVIRRCYQQALQVDIDPGVEEVFLVRTRLLFVVIDLVDRSQVEAKRYYTRMIGAHLSLHERLFLAYYVIASNAGALKNLMEKYGFFVGIDRHLLKPTHSDFFETGTFSND